MSLMRTYRQALRLSQSAFAAQLHVPLETYPCWLLAPSTRTIRASASGLSVSAD